MASLVTDLDADLAQFDTTEVWMRRQESAAATVLEASPGVGGLCRSYTRDGYTFDVSGHLLHFRQPTIRRLVGGLVPGALARHRRRALVRSGRRWVHYPFQAHLFELPARARDECLRGFFKAAGEKEAGAATPGDFEGWLRHHFGAGIVKHFLGPYNRKMWRVPLRRIDPAWAAWAVPVPTPEQVQSAGRPGADLRLGYNPLFYYPRQGGVGVLATALARPKDYAGSDGPVKTFRVSLRPPWFGRPRAARG